MEPTFQAFPSTFLKKHLIAGDYTGDSQNPHYHDADSSASDCESGVTGDSSHSSTTAITSRRRRRGMFPEKVATEVPKGEKAYEVICRRFIAGMGEKASVVAIHQRNTSEYSAQARAQAFQVYYNALKSKQGGSPKVKFGWYGGDKERIEQILSYGFSHQDVLDNVNGAIYLSPDDFPSQSVEDSGADVEGLRHVLLCRVLLGRSELVQPKSGQTHPSSDEFDSGLDASEDLKKYIVWSSNMNTHILPEYVVTFKVHAAQQSIPKGIMKKGIRMPKSPWISFPALISVLAKYLPADAVSLINKYHTDYKERKIMRRELIQKVRQIAGDNMLIAVIKSYKNNKGLKMPFGLSHVKN